MSQSSDMHSPTRLTSHVDRSPSAVLLPSQKYSRYGNRVNQTFSTLTRFVKNTCNIYISK
jgi:hypothetical protein